MPFELIFTSAPRGLRPGSFGYCTVARHSGIPEALVADLEKMSGFDLPPGIGNVEAIYSFQIRERPNGKHWIFSRKRASDLPDYTGRNNYVAHHLVFEEREVESFCSAGSAVTPASVLLTYNWLGEFEGEARLLEDEESKWKEIWDGANSLPHDFSELHAQLNPEAARRLVAPGLFDDEIAPKPACLVSRDLPVNDGALRLLRFLHFATLLTSPWRGRFCGDNLYEGSNFPVNPRLWWNWGITTMLVYNDNAARYYWIGAAEERGAAAASRSRTVLNLDDPPAESGGPEILTKLIADPSACLAEPDQKLFMRRQEEAEERMSQTFAGVMEARSAFVGRIRERQRAEQEYAQAVQTLEERQALLGKLIASTSQGLRAVGGGSCDTVIPGCERGLISVSNLDGWRLNLRNALGLFETQEKAVAAAESTVNRRTDECLQAKDALTAQVNDFPLAVEREADGLSERSGDFRSRWDEKAQSLKRVNDESLLLASVSLRPQGVQASEGKADAKKWLNVLEEGYSRAVARRASQRREQVGIGPWLRGVGRFNTNIMWTLLAGVILLAVFATAIFGITRIPWQSGLDSIGDAFYSLMHPGTRTPPTEARTSFASTPRPTEMPTLPQYQTSLPQQSPSEIYAVVTPAAPPQSATPAPTVAHDDTETVYIKFYEGNSVESISVPINVPDLVGRLQGQKPVVKEISCPVAGLPLSKQHGFDVEISDSEAGKPTLADASKVTIVRSRDEFTVTGLGSFEQNGRGLFLSMEPDFLLLLPRLAADVPSEIFSGDFDAFFHSEKSTYSNDNVLVTPRRAIPTMVFPGGETVEWHLEYQPDRRWAGLAQSIQDTKPQEGSQVKNVQEAELNLDRFGSALFNYWQHADGDVGPVSQDYHQALVDNGLAVFSDTESNSATACIRARLAQVVVGSRQKECNESVNTLNESESAQAILMTLIQINNNFKNAANPANNANQAW